MARKRVYFIQSGGREGPIKIGHARTPEARLRELQCGNPDELCLLVSFPERGWWSEAEIHQRFATDRLRGEWFSPEGVLRFIDDVLVVTGHRSCETCDALASASVHCCSCSLAFERLGRRPRDRRLALDPAWVAA